MCLVCSCIDSCSRLLGSWQCKQGQPSHKSWCGRCWWSSLHHQRVHPLPSRRRCNSSTRWTKEASCSCSWKHYWPTNLQDKNPHSRSIRSSWCCNSRTEQARIPTRTARASSASWAETPEASADRWIFLCCQFSLSAFTANFCSRESALIDIIIVIINIRTRPNCCPVTNIILSCSFYHPRHSRHHHPFSRRVPFDKTFDDQNFPLTPWRGKENHYSNKDINIYCNDSNRPCLFAPVKQET